MRLRYVVLIYVLKKRDFHGFANYTYCLQAATGTVVSDTEMNAKPVANKTDEKGGEAKYTNHTLDEVASMVRATVSAFDTKVQLVRVWNFNVEPWYLGQLIVLVVKHALTSTGSEYLP